MKTPTPYIHENGYYGIFNDSFPPILDGVTLTVENYANQLKLRGMDPCVVTPYNPTIVDCDYKVIKYFSLPIRSRHPYRYGYPRFDPYIWKKLNNTKFNIVHCHCPFSSGRLGVYVKKKQGTPLIGTFHSKYKADLMHSFRHAPWFVSIIMKRILDFFNSCDEVWIPQASVEETVREYGYKGPLTVMENGSDMETLSGGNVEEFRKESKHLAGLNDNELSLIFVGQHILEKGVDIIIKALSLIKGKVNFRMTFIGTGYAKDEMKRLVRDYGIEDRVQFLGVINSREQLAHAYAAADLFLFPSMYDNAPLVVREAAAMHVPTILIEGSTASEVITDGENGFLIKHTPDDMASAIIRLNAERDKISRVGLNASNSLVRSWSDIVDEVIDRYNSLIRRKVNG